MISHHFHHLFLFINKLLGPVTLKGRSLHLKGKGRRLLNDVNIMKQELLGAILEAAYHTKMFSCEAAQ